MRELSGFWKKLTTAMAIILILFQLYTATFGVLIDLLQRTIHATFVLTMIFIRMPATKKLKGTTKVQVYDIALALLSIVCCGYIMLHHKQLIVNGLLWFGTLDKILAVCMVLLYLEAARRTVGWAFPVMAALLMFYGFQGELFPGIWGHKNLMFSTVFQNLYHTTTGCWGSMLGLSAGMIAMFTIFGQILGNTGGSQTFIKVGEKLAGASVGGSGKVALISSGLFGMISGQTAAIVLATGTFTIPMMRKDGYNKEWAASISAVGATGGQIMPPIMGSGAFIMAQILGISYMTIAKSAAIPAVLYYFGALVAVHYVSKKFGVLGHKKKFSIGFWEALIIAAPLGVFITILVMGYTVTKGALYATFVSVLVCAASYLSENKRQAQVAVKKTGKLCFDTAIGACDSILTIAGLLMGAQIVISLVSLTGFGLKLSTVIVSVGQNNLLICLILSMVVCLVLGMGMPTTAAYVLGSSVLGPALMQLGLAPLVTHLFIFYWACISSITPPVCCAVFISSGIAESNWVKTGFLSCFIALPVFVVPYTFAYNPALMLDGSIVEMIIGVASAVLGAYIIGIAVAGYTNKDVNIIFRLIMIAGGVMLLIPTLWVSLVGLAVSAVVWVLSTDMKNLGKKASSVAVAQSGNE